MEPTTKNWKKVKMDKLRSIGKQSGESIESVLKKEMKATVGRKDGYYVWGGQVFWLPANETEYVFAQYACSYVFSESI